MKKLPFKKYTTLSNILVSKLGCSDVYRAYVLSLTTDKVNNTTDTTLEQLAGFIGEKVTAYNGNSKSKSFNNTLKDTQLVTITSKMKQSIKSDKKVTRNTYTFINTSTFRMIGVEFYHLDLDIKLKGYLLKLFSIANVNTLEINISANKVYEKIKVSKATQKKYNDILVEKGLLVKTDNGYILQVEGFNRIEKRIQATEKTMKILKNHSDIIISHLQKHNLEFNRKNLRFCLDKGLDRHSFMLGIYMLKDFKGVTDINRLVDDIISGACDADCKKRKEKADKEKARLRDEMENIIL